MLPTALVTAPVVLTTNWQDTGGSAADYTYYDPTAFVIDRVHPLGGPAAGGTLLTVYLVDDRLLVDLGGQNSSGLRCRFSMPNKTAPADGISMGMRVKPRNQPPYVLAEQKEVLANLTNCNGMRRCGAGWAAMSCVTPSLLSWEHHHPPRSVVVEVSINGQDYTSGGVTYDSQYIQKAAFTLYGPVDTLTDSLLGPRLVSFRPIVGPVAGGTVLIVHGSGFSRLGDVHCRFTSLNVTTNATIASPELMHCLTPRNWLAEATSSRRMTTGVEVTLNGQQYHGLNALEAYPFRYYWPDHTLGLSVRNITPHGGGDSGDTLVTVRGTGFDRGSQGATTPECRFGEHGVVPATIVSPEVMVCHSPPRAGNASSQTFAVEVGLNYEPVAFTAAAAASFTYHSTLHVSTIHPLGGHEAGGTLLTITGSHFAELDHGDGLQCLFGGPDPSDAVASNATIAAAPVSTITCRSPPLSSITAAGVCLTDAVTVRLTNNGRGGPNDVSVDALSFLYFNTSRNVAVRAAEAEEPVGVQHFHEHRWAGA